MLRERLVPMQNEKQLEAQKKKEKRQAPRGNLPCNAVKND
jgi:hypothetical protein